MGVAVPGEPPHADVVGMSGHGRFQIGHRLVAKTSSVMRKTVNGRQDAPTNIKASEPGRGLRPLRDPGALDDDGKDE
ncbi:hypothetical protein [Streptomyces sp. NPDC007110]|uniref:hypothetical protein n=1 Tax=Streptomyces sp. NPDC007110 TaxID=3156916 RepID=UPI0033F68BD0